MKTIAILCIVILVVFCGFQVLAECPTFCTLEYMPLCATNGTHNITFGNQCALLSYNCEHSSEVAFDMIRRGECQSQIAVTVQEN